MQPGEQLKYADARRRNAQQRLTQAMLAQLRSGRQELSSRVRSLDALSPLKVMSRGYSLLYQEGGKLVRSVEDTAVGETVQVLLADGSLDCTVINKERS